LLIHSAFFIAFYLQKPLAIMETVVMEMVERYLPGPPGLKPLKKAANDVSSSLELHRANEHDI
jgi:hypothetical protein